MGSMNVYNDNSQDWGSIGSGIASSIMGAPQKAAAFTHTIETIKAMRAKAEQDKAQWDATLGAVNNVDAATAPAAVAPRAYTAADISTPAVLDAPLSVTDRTTGIHGGADVPNGMFTDPRELAKAEADRRLAIAGQKAAIMAHPEQWSQQTALGNVASAGVPTDPYARAKLDFLAGKGMPTHIGPDDTKNPIKMWVPINEKNEVTGQAVASREDPSRPGQRFSLSGPISAEEQNPLKDEGARAKLLSDYTAKITDPNFRMSVPEAVKIAQALQMNYGTENKIQSDGYGRIVVFKGFQPREIPDNLHGRLAQQVNEVLGGITAAQPAAGATAAAAPAPGATAAATPAPVIATGPRPIQTDIVSDASSDKADAAAMVALTQVKEARGQLLAHLGADANGVLPQRPRVPNWGAAMANEALGGTTAGNNLINAADPNALSYFQTSKRLVEPILRLASGAAINKGEYKDYYEMFIPTQADSPQMIANKLNAIRTWQVAVSKSRTASGLLQMASDLGQDNPVVRATVERLRVKANEGGRANDSFATLPAGAGGGSGDSVVDEAASIVRGAGGRR